MVKLCCVMATLGAATIVIESDASGDERHPNVVFILADDFGYGDASCYGATKVTTPNIDRLARGGMRFTDAHSSHSVCTPTRYAFLTGRYAWRSWSGHRCVWSNDPLLIETDRYTVGKLFQSLGYKTACIGKWHLGFGSPETPGWSNARGPDYNRALKPGPLEVGFDYFYGIPHVGQYPHIYIENHHVVGLNPADPLQIQVDERLLSRSSYLERLNIVPRHTFLGGKAALYEHEDLAIHLTEKAVDWLGNQQADAPFFLYFAHRNVHSPLRPHPRFKGTSDIGVYGDFINELDWSVGELLGALDANGLTENTLIIFTSDNGAVAAGHQPATVVNHQGHHANGHLWGQKTEVYEGGHRVPFIVSWPGQIPEGSQSDRLVSTADMLATFAEMFDVTLPNAAGEDSFSFASALLETESTGPQRTSIVHDSNQGLSAIRDGDWKLILGQGGGGIGWTPETDSQLPAGQLFNMADDPREQQNMYDKHPEIVTRLTKLFELIRQNGSRTDDRPIGDFD